MDSSEPSLFNIGAPPPPALHLLQLATGHWAPQILRVFCKLRIADLLTLPKSPSQLAEECGALPDMLFRFLRTAEMVGVCKQVGRVSLHFPSLLNLVSSFLRGG